MKLVRHGQRGEIDDENIRNLSLKSFYFFLIPIIFKKERKKKGNKSFIKINYIDDILSTNNK